MNSSTITAGYWSMRQVRQRFDCSARTIYRWMKLEDSPFPQPVHRRPDSHNLWVIEVVRAWEEAEMSQAA